MSVVLCLAHSRAMFGLSVAVHLFVRLPVVPWVKVATCTWKDFHLSMCFLVEKNVPHYGLTLCILLLFFFLNYYICHWNQIILLRSVICIILAFSQKIPPHGRREEWQGRSPQNYNALTMQINIYLPDYTVSHLRGLWSWPTEYL